MALVAPGALVAPIPRVPLPYGLNSYMGWRSGDRFEGGSVVWEGLTCAPAGGRGGPDCTPEAEIPGMPKVLTAGPITSEGTSFYVWGEYECNPVGNSLSYAEEQALAHLTAREEGRVEQALWMGDLGNTPNLVQSNPTIVPGAFGPQEALGALEAFIATNYGSQGVIHMTRYAATVLAKFLEKRGGRLYTRALDTPVIAGGGYTGTRPDNVEDPDPDGVTWMFATPAMLGYRGDILTTTNRPGDLLDRANNKLYAIAERGYLLGWDDCGTAAVMMDPCECVSLPPTPPEEGP